MMLSQPSTVGCHWPVSPSLASCRDIWHAVSSSSWLLHACTMNSAFAWACAVRPPSRSATTPPQSDTKTDQCCSPPYTPSHCEGPRCHGSPKFTGDVFFLAISFWGKQINVVTVHTSRRPKRTRVRGHARTSSGPASGPKPAAATWPDASRGNAGSNPPIATTGDRAEMPGSANDCFECSWSVVAGK